MKGNPVVRRSSLTAGVAALWLVLALAACSGGSGGGDSGGSTGSPPAQSPVPTPTPPPPSGDTQAPSTPTGVSATVVSTTQINLGWSASTDNVGVSGYRVYRNGTQIALASGTSYSNTGLTASTNYSYTVAAYDAAGNVSAQSTAVLATTLPAIPGGSNARLLFTDVASVPRNGFVTVWGVGLGATGTLRVGGAAIPSGDIISWGADPNLTGFSRIEFRQTVNGAGTVTVDGATGSLALAQHTGRLLFVDRNNGSNTNNGLAATNQGSGIGPWQTLPHARVRMEAGDVLYVRTGRYGEMDDDVWDSLFQAYDVHGTATQPYALIGYPGDAPILDGSMAAGLRRFTMTGNYWTVAKLRFENGTAQAVRADGNWKRIVGNVFTNTGPSGAGVVQFDASTHVSVFGNYFFDYGYTGSNQSHGIYHGGYASGNTDIEIAYNRMLRQRGGRHIQFYGHTAGERTTDIRIHHNYLDTGPYDGILLGRSDGGQTDPWMEGVQIYNNTIRNTSRSCIYMGAVGSALNAVIQRNVCYDSVQSSILVTSGSTGTTDIGFNCLDRAVSDNVGPPTSIVHDNELTYPACAAGKGHLSF